MAIDLAVVFGYFGLLVIITGMFKRMGSSTSTDYFRGGGRMLWWMVGSTAFMTQFSAWTFTGAAGEAFTNGLDVTFVFIGNVFAYLIAYFWFAPHFRQTRVDTPTEIINRRFGGVNEQFFTWAIIPLSIINGGVWLNGLGVFASAMFEVDMTTTLWVIGLLVLGLSLVSGAWGVVASDFVQALVVAVMSVACAIVALVLVGGPMEIVDKFPSGFVMGEGMNHGLILVCSLLFFLVKQLQSINNMRDSYRFLNARDSDHARKAAMFALVLMMVGTLIWFIPPWASAVMYPDAAGAYSAQLGKRASDAIFLYFADHAMPLGTVGLLMAGLFAATMSSMDSALNSNSGIFVRSFLQPIVFKNRQVGDKALLRAGQAMSAVSGLLVIVMAQYFSRLQGLSLFDLMMRVSTLVQGPILVPLFFGMFVRKVPDWAAWTSVVVGCVVSYLFGVVLDAKTLSAAFGWTLTARELSTLDTTLIIAVQLFITGGYFCLTSFFYREPQEARQKQLDRFFDDLSVPVVAGGARQSEYDRLQREKLGNITMFMGIGLLLMVFIPNPMWGRLMFFGCSAAISFIGFMLRRSAKRTTIPADYRDETAFFAASETNSNR